MTRIVPIPLTDDPELERFRNRLCKLACIDFHDLVEAGVMPPGEEGSRDFSRFLANPWSWFIRADDDKLSKLWRLMEGRRP